jgi:hypothetical protein
MMTILFLIAVLSTAGAFFVDDHFVRAVMIIIAIVFALIAFSGTGRKKSINEWVRLAFWP